MSELFSLMSLLVGCGPKTPVQPLSTPAPPPALQPIAESGEVTPPSLGEPMGGTGLGFVEASSANGRYVVIRRWEPGVLPSFGYHGEPSVQPQLVLLNAVSHSEVLLDDIIDVDPLRRWMVARVANRVVVFDSLDGEQLTLQGAQPDSDGNPCLPARAAAFSAGEPIRLAWPDDEGALQVMDMSTQEQWALRSDDRIWRAWPDTETTGAYVLTVAAATTGWPTQQTSCACLWCNRFAMSYGVYGWSGPEFTSWLLSADGR